MKDENNQSGICYKLFQFIMNSLVSRGIKRITLGHAPTTPAKLNGEEEKEHRQARERPDDDLSSKIDVKFMQTDEVASWTPVDDQLELDSSFHVLHLEGTNETALPQSQKDTEASKQLETPDHDKRIMSYTPREEKELPLVQAIDVSKDQDITSKDWDHPKPLAQAGTKTQETKLMPSITTMPHEKGTKQSKNIEYSISKEKQIEKGKEEKGGDGLKLALEGEDNRRERSVKQGMSFSRVVSNINDKAEAFIRRRREAMMRRNASMEENNL